MDGLLWPISNLFAYLLRIVGRSQSLGLVPGHTPALFRPLLGLVPGHSPAASGYQLHHSGHSQGQFPANSGHINLFSRVFLRLK